MSKSTKMRAVLISIGTVAETETDGSLDSMYHLIDCNCLCSAGYITLPGRARHAVWADDEGLFQKGPIAVTHPRWYPQPLVGNLLITGITPEGDTCAATLSIEEVRGQIRAQGLYTGGAA